MTVPVYPKLYHIVHVDRLASIIAAGGLLCDAKLMVNQTNGTTIGLNSIKQRRLRELRLNSYPDLHVGDCVPFYFCPRSIMLYMIYQANHPELEYQGGQEPILHLQADLRAVVDWADVQQRRWVFTLSNAGSYYFEDRRNLENLDHLDWQAIQARQWQDCKEGKQAEFLLEKSFPWELIEYIGVKSPAVYQQVMNIFQKSGHHPKLEIKRDWYY